MEPIHAIHAPRVISREAKSSEGRRGGRRKYCDQIHGISFTSCRRTIKVLNGGRGSAPPPHKGSTLHECTEPSTNQLMPVYFFRSGGTTVKTPRWVRVAAAHSVCDRDQVVLGLIPATRVAVNAPDSRVRGRHGRSPCERSRPKNHLV